MAPNKELITAYTYGEPGCKDIIEASKTSKSLNIAHKEILFNTDFVNELPHYLMETVYISSGLQGILRATLLYAYSKLKELLPDHNLVISGIMMDTMFRGHIGMPTLTPNYIARIFKTGQIEINKEKWSSVFNNNYEAFNNYILSDFDIIQNLYGNILNEEFYILYITYIASKFQFLGEYRIASNFNTIRVTAWDNEIIDLAFSIEYSALKTARKEKKLWRGRDEFLLQSYLMSYFFPNIIKIPIKNMRPDLVLAGDLYFKYYAKYNRITSILKSRLIQNKNAGFLENWEQWLNIKYKNFISDLIFSNNSRIREYLSDNFINEVKKNMDINIVGKLTTLEIILRLINNGWKRFW